jgi:hypothetical protein
MVLTRNPKLIRNKTPHLLEESAIQICLGDVRTFAPPDGEFLCVIHAASAGSSDQGHNPVDIFGTTVDGTRRQGEMAY